MFKDTVPNTFVGIYLVCGYADFRYRINSLAAITEKRYRKSLFVLNPLSFSAVILLQRYKDFLWNELGFLRLTKPVRWASLPAYVHPVPSRNYPSNNTIETPSIILHHIS